jgi:hypothetical protein
VSDCVLALVLGVVTVVVSYQCGQSLVSQFLQKSVSDVPYHLYRNKYKLLSGVNGNV